MLSKVLRRRDQGDTLIEVLFAVMVFSLVIVTALTIMNQGSASAQRSLEMTLVRQQVDNQAETLRFLHESYVKNYREGYADNPNLTLTGATGEFYKIVQRVKSTGANSVSAFGNNTTCTTPPGGSFILNPRTARLVTTTGVLQPAPIIAQLVFDTTTPTSLTRSEGMWIEAIRSPNSTDPSQQNSGYIDFHIRACWYAPGSKVASNVGTIVRLYEPRS